ncbi:MAG: phosphoribosylanthranilate isomerase [Vicinamibacterales bacterium]
MVKICGITRAEDAALAVELGAGAVGFVFWPGSPRYIEAARARAIVDSLPPFVTPVGVFVNQAPDAVNTVADRARLAAVQLHGDETVADAERIDRPILKAVTPADADRAATEWPHRIMLLIDAHDAARRGGTGKTTDWSVAAALAARRRTLLAGGLRPENVAEAIARVRPFGIDISSGVEASPGIKDHDRLRALFQAVSLVQAGS